ncbi:hypothetical protein EEL49_06490 [Muribaculaceae bacterium Isolate-104 (HZI)]|jgi:hypothetical protein|nr:hypothetical protein EEL49_06490 [Muribaculaceae bacterium Isolate-104 (HZI)]
MKTNKYLFAILVIASGVGIYTSIQADSSVVNVMLDANEECLADIENIGGKWFNVDQIPCASTASELRIDYSYINCSTCKKEAGKASEIMNGTCASIRELDI